MFKVSVMYPNQKDSHFDLEYYRTKHMALVEKHMKPFGLLRTEVLRGISGGGGQPAPYVCIGNLYFDSADGYEKGGQPPVVFSVQIFPISPMWHQYARLAKF